MRISDGDSVLLEMFCLPVTPEVTKLVDFYVYFCALRVLSVFLANASGVSVHLKPK